MWRRVLVLSVGVFLSCGAQQPSVCGVGDTRACLGPGACEGAQVCLETRAGFGACDCGSGQQRDAGVVLDAGLPDAGVPDAGAEDAGLPDAGVEDAGLPDAGAEDAGLPDAGVPDAGAVDAGVDAGIDTGPPPQLDLSLHRTAVNTELGRTQSLIVSLVGTNGFGGLVTLQLEQFSADGGMPDWDFSVPDASVLLPVDGTTTRVASLSVPSNARELAGLVRVTAVSAADAGMLSASASVVVLPRYTVALAVDGGACIYPPAGDVPLLVGTTLRWLNVSAQDTFNIHVDGAGAAVGCGHQPTTDSVLPGGDYSCLLSGPGSFSWNCHAPGPNTSGLTFSVTP